MSRIILILLAKTRAHATPKYPKKKLASPLSEVAVRAISKRTILKQVKRYFIKGVDYFFLFVFLFCFYYLTKNKFFDIYLFLCF